MSRIKLHCETCNYVHDLEKTPELPAHVFFIHCNWCPLCEERAEDYYQEWWDDNEDGNNRKELPIPVPDNQLVMPFIFDELEIPNQQIQTV